MVFCTFYTCRASVTIIFRVSILLTVYILYALRSFLCLGRFTVTIVFKTFLILNISLLLFLGSSSIRNSGNGCLVSYLVMLFIDLTWCPIFAISSHMLSYVFIFGCNPLITAF